MIQNSDILIIGAGIAGLACAKQLHERGKSFKIYEASNKCGGRLKEFDFNGQKMEAGGEFIHNHDNQYYKLMKNLNIKLQKYEDADYTVYDPLQNRIISESDIEKKNRNICEIYKQLSKLNNKADLSMEQFLEQYPKQYQHLYEALYGSEYGASLDKISAQHVGYYENIVPDDAHDYGLVNQTHINMLMNTKKEQQINISDVLQFIHYDRQVIQIEIIDNYVDVSYLYDGQMLREQFNKVVICIPITQLKKLKFIPPLPENKQQSLNLVGMEKGLKIFIQIDKPILKKDAILVPKLNHGSVLWQSTMNNSTYLVGLVKQDGYEQFKQIGEQQFIEIILNQINQQYQKNSQIIRYHIENWGDAQYIEGLYSYPLVNAPKDYRNILFEPIDNKIYFAGEAYHNKYYQTIHGAYETGIKVGQTI